MRAEKREVAEVLQMGKKGREVRASQEEAEAPSDASYPLLYGP